MRCFKQIWKRAGVVFTPAAMTAALAAPEAVVHAWWG